MSSSCCNNTVVVVAAPATVVCYITQQCILRFSLSSAIPVGISSGNGKRMAITRLEVMGRLVPMGYPLHSSWIWVHIPSVVRCMLSCVALLTTSPPCGQNCDSSSMALASTTLAAAAATATTVVFQLELL